MIIRDSFPRIWQRRVSLLRIAAPLLAIAAYSGGCSRSADSIEAGALLLLIHVPATGSLPGELRVWTYDDRGVVFRNAAVSGYGGSVAAAGAADRNLGTVFIQPGASAGQLRLHVRGMLDGARILDGVARVPADARTHGRFDLTLGTDIPPDADGDDVPDLIDDCPEYPDPDQTGCPGSGNGDASPDAAQVRDGGSADGNGGGAGGGAARGAGGTGGTGGTPATGSGGAKGTGGSLSDASVSDATGSGVDTRPADAQTHDTQAEVGRKSAGVSCGGAGECASGFCVDGVCCLKACNQECESCGAFGLCTTVTNRKDVPECAGSNSCNNRGKCVAN